MPMVRNNERGQGEESITEETPAALKPLLEPDACGGIENDTRRTANSL